MIFSAVLFFIPAAFAADITGAGATFPYPVYAKWVAAYQKATGIRLNYHSIGSGGGLKQIKAKAIDFGASDKPLTVEESEKSGLTQSHGYWRCCAGNQYRYPEGGAVQINRSSFGRYFSR